MNPTGDPSGAGPGQHFVYRLIPPRPTFGPGDMSGDEAAVMAEHAGYWQRLTDEGKVVVFGPVVAPSGTWGLAVVKAADEDEVTALGQDDPAVTSGTCTFEVGMMPVTVLPG